MTLTRSHKIKLALLAALLAVAAVRETDWAKRTFALDGYWDEQVRHRELAVWEAERDIAALEDEMQRSRDPADRVRLEAELADARGEAEELRRDLETARTRQ